MTFGRRLAATVMWVPLLVSGGCTDDPEPKMAPPDETPTSTSPSPSATATPQPWEKKTNAGAVAFAKHWIDVFSVAMSTGETKELAALSDEGCITCANVIDRIATVYGAGGAYDTDGWKVIQADAVNGGSGNASVAMSVHRSTEVYRDSSGAKPKRNPDSRAAYSARLDWVDGGWRMLGLDLAP